MKFQDFPEVTELTVKLGRLAQAISQAEVVVSNTEISGYSVHLSECSDGSGLKINMEGCYVATKIAAATQKVLEDEHKATVNDLKDLGVEF